MKLIIPLFLVLILGKNAVGSTSFIEPQNHCFQAIQKHISSAIKHNQKVAPRYAELSNGDSRFLSTALIQLEKISLFFAKKMDRESRFYQERGIPLLCDELIDMNQLPPFQDQLPEASRPVHFYHYDYKKMNRNLKDFIKENRLNDAYQEIAYDLKTLDDYPYQWCITRHFLESIARTIMLSLGHRAQAQKLGLPDPINVIKKFVALQRRALPLAQYLDTKAFPLQKQGLLIYCQDLPVIPWE
jgi:hypothetical protein